MDGYTLSLHAKSIAKRKRLNLFGISLHSNGENNVVTTLPMSVETAQSESVEHSHVPYTQAAGWIYLTFAIFCCSSRRFGIHEDAIWIHRWTRAATLGAIKHFAVEGEIGGKK